MGLVVIILILIITLMFIFGIKGDEWFNQGKPSHHTHYYYDDDDDDFDSFNNYHNESESQSSPDNEMFYGGIPMATVLCILQMMIFVMNLVMSFIKMETV